MENKIKFSIEQFTIDKEKQKSPIISKFKNKIRKLENNQKNEIKNLEKSLKEINEKNINEKN